MTIEIEHPPKTNDIAIKESEMEFKKDNLAREFGWTHEDFDNHLITLKEFLTDQKKNETRLI